MSPEVCFQTEKLSVGYNLPSLQAIDLGYCSQMRVSVAPISIPPSKEGHLSGADRVTLPNQFDGLNLSVHCCRWCNQDYSITMKFDAADKIPIHIVLDR